ncbi:MAG: hypothetical protein Q8J78_03085 [Moraxellaceae bacterium]|nr:hypothetical protein [Moraxellaceae bacterium]
MVVLVRRFGHLPLRKETDSGGRLRPWAACRQQTGVAAFLTGGAAKHEARNGAAGLLFLPCSEHRGFALPALTP